MPSAKGTFKVDLKTQGESSTVDAVTIGRKSIDKVFEGGITGTSVGEMLSAGGAVKGSAGYVAIERVSGTVDGRAGTFVLQHHATMDRGTPALSIIVVPDTGTSELAGISGAFKLDIREGVHYYELEYEIATP